MQQTARIWFAAGLLWTAASAMAQPAMALRDSGDAAFLYAYTIKPGMRAQFERGYQAHLRWHGERRDPLPWYGWFVLDGPRVGTFMDGSFGVPLRAFDQRVDPAGDAADGMRNVTNYAEPVSISSYRLRREFSTGFPLERWQPSRQLQVLRYRLRPGMRTHFERALAAAYSRQRNAAVTSHSWYQPLSGTNANEWLLLVARSGWADYADVPAMLEDTLAGSPQLVDLAAAVDSVSSETWGYRADLSLLPQP